MNKLLIVLYLLSAAGHLFSDDTTPVRIPISSSLSWQLEGKINTEINSDVFIIDAFDSSTVIINKLHKKGKIVIAYISVGTFED